MKKHEQIYDIHVPQHVQLDWTKKKKHARAHESTNGGHHVHVHQPGWSASIGTALVKWKIQADEELEI